MARSANQAAYPAYLPRSWRVVTIAGVTTVGLGIGLVQPAPAEWLKQSSKPTARSSTRPIPAENGFTATIRRLMSDSRRAADAGDYAKAVQLAERAVKISEATAQLLGPTSECSPQETARFLAEMRAARDGRASMIAAQPQPSEPAPQTLNRTAGNTSASATAAKSAINGASQPAAASRSSQPVVAATAKPQNRSLTDTASAAPVKAGGLPARAPDAGNGMIANTHKNSPRKQEVPAGSNQPKIAQQQQLPPAPANLTSPVDQFLAKSRMAAADGDLESAVELAKQAAAASSARSLFGAGSIGPKSVEATQWLDNLLAQQRAQAQLALTTQESAGEEVFEPPLKVSSKPKPKTSETGVAVAPVGNEFVPSDGEQAPSIEPAVASSSSSAAPTAETSRNSDADALWSRDLPTTETPTTTLAHEPVSFTRRAIDASTGWVDADALERTADNPGADSVADSQSTVVAISTADQPAPQIESRIKEPAAEFSNGNVSRQGDAAEVEKLPIEPDGASSSETARVPSAELTGETTAGPSIEPTPEAMITPDSNPESDVAFPSKSEAVLEQPSAPMPEKAHESPPVEAITSDSSSATVPRAPLRFRKQPVQTADFNFDGSGEAVQQPEPVSPTETREPLRLRPQIQQVAAESASSGDNQSSIPQRFTRRTSENAAQPIKPLPQSFAEIAADAIEAPAEESAADAPVQRFPVQRVLKLRQRIEEAASLNPGGQPTSGLREQSIPSPQSSSETPDRNSAVPQETPKPTSTALAQPAIRPAIKLRERTRLKLDEPLANSSSTPVPKTPSTNRQPVVARSTSNVWKSIDTQKTPPSPSDTEPAGSADRATAATQPMLPPPITQAGFEEGDLKTPAFQKTGLSVKETSRDVKPEFDAAPVPPESAETYPWHDDGASEKKPWKSDVAVKKSSFALIDQLADAFNVPAKTLVSLVMGAGAMLVAGGLVAIRAALRRRHSA